MGNRSGLVYMCHRHKFDDRAAIGTALGLCKNCQYKQHARDLPNFSQDRLPPVSTNQTSFVCHQQQQGHHLQNHNFQFRQSCHRNIKLIHHHHLHYCHHHHHLPSPSSSAKPGTSSSATTTSSTLVSFPAA